MAMITKANAVKAGGKSTQQKVPEEPTMDITLPTEKGAKGA